MRAVGIKVLKNRLSEYVRLAAGGETILIADRDRVVAEIVPPRETRSANLPDAMLAEMVREGTLTPALLPPGRSPRKAPPVPGLTLRQLLREIDEDRRDR